jgi:predicted PurR-regulated permease PerM
VVCVVIGLFVLGVLAIALAVDVFLMAFMSLLLAIFLHTLASWLNQYWSLGPVWSLVTVVLLLLLIFVAAGWFLVPTIAEQLQTLQSKWPASISSLRGRLGSTTWGSWLLQQLPDTEQAWPEIQATLSRATGIVTSAIGGVGVVVVVLALGLMLAAQPQVYQDGFFFLVPPSRRVRAKQVFEKIGSTLQWWLIAKCLAMLIVGLLTWLGLFLLGVEMAATLAVLAALLTFVPNFGPILAAVPAVLLAFLQGPMIALWVVLLYIAIQTVESFVITPLIQYRALAFPPVLVIVSQLVASACLGIWGLALATPLLAVTVVLVRMLYVEDILREGAPLSAEDGNNA